jgi:tRNA(adenine34) deaminase
MTSEHYMKLALQEAKKAYEKDEVPVGAVLVMNNQILAKSYNQVELLKDATAHAEILALTSAFDSLGSKYLPEATLYVTVEPCLMCAGALNWSKIGKIVYGASDDKNGSHTYCHKSPSHPKTVVEKGVLKEECAQLMKDFFKAKRGS